MRTVSLLLLFAAASLAPAHQSMACGGIVVSLKEQAVVDAPTVFLGDVADVSGADQDRVRLLVGLPVAAAPPLGSVLTLDEALIRRQVNAALKGSADLTISGASVVEVILRGRNIEADELIPLIKAHLLETTSWKESEIEIRSIGNLKGVDVPHGDVSLRIPKTSFLSGVRGALIPIEIHLDGNLYRTFWTNVDVRINASILQASRRIPYGSTIAAEDLKVGMVEIQDFRVACFRSPEDAIGLVSRRTLLPGDPLTPESVTKPLLVRNGETVRLRLERDGIHVAALVRAEQDGKLGQFIRVRNLDFSRPLRAQVVGRREVKVE